MERMKRPHFLNREVGFVILGLLPIEWVTFKTYSAGNMQVRTLRRKYS